MHVALFCHRPLPARGYGGTQRVVVWLARGLAELGHRVTLLAPSGSRVPEATLIGLDSGAITRRGFNLTRWLPDSIDILHTHVPLATAPERPYLLTLHGNLRPGSNAPANTIFLSADHARRHQRTAFVYNGADPADFSFRPEKDTYDLFLGRLHSAKGYRWAIEGAKRSRRRLVIAGGWRPSLRPRLHYAGSVDGRRKAELLAGAACLWMPALWDEPFGLTLVEAMVSGTPVLGTCRGALPEIVSAEVGALGETLEDLVRLRDSIENRDPAACRARAVQWFSHTRMAQEYVRMYQQYLLTNTLPPGQKTG
jgi:glycosyltransferase involved in cell wall biosynthesis